MLTKLIKAASATALLALGVLAEVDSEQVQNLIPEKCLFKSEAIGMPIEGVSTKFDQTAAIVEMLPADAKPSQWRVCTDAQGALTSIQLIYAVGSGLKAKMVELPRAGPMAGSCVAKAYGSRSYPDMVRIFEQNSRIVGLGVMFSEEDLFKFGAPSVTAKEIEIDPAQHIVGFFGASGAKNITQLGLVIEDVACAEAHAEKVRLEMEQLRLAMESSGNGS